MSQDLSSPSGRQGLPRRGIARALSGVLDAGAASLATFAVGLFAAISLPAEELGVYAFGFSVHLFLASLPYQLLLTPLLATVAKAGPNARDAYTSSGLRAATPIAAIAAALAGLAVIAMNDLLSSRDILWFGGSVALATALHGPQMFARQMLHFQGRTASAVAVSLSRLAATVVAIVVLRTMPLPGIAIPLFALSIGSAFAILGALYVARAGHRVPDIGPTHRRSLIARGKFLVAGVALPLGVQAIVSYSVVRMAGPAALGFAEAARVVAQPVLVGALGLELAMNPPLMRAVIDGNRSRTRLISTGFMAMLLLSATTYAILLAFDDVRATLTDLLPAAFAVEGLVLVSIGTAAAVGLSFPFRSRLIASTNERALFVREIPGSIAALGLGLLAPWLGAFTRPLSGATGGLMRTALFSRHANQSKRLDTNHP